MRRRPAFSLVEMMVAMVITMAVFAITLPFVRAQTRSLGSTAGRMDADQIARFAMRAVEQDLRRAAGEGIVPSEAAIARMGEAELGLVKQAAQFPRIVEAAAAAREPHRIAFYLYDLASAFHSFYNLGNDDTSKRVILAQDAELSAARLFLIAAIGQVIRNGLTLLGVEAVEEM